MANVSRSERIRRQWRTAIDPTAQGMDRQMALYALAQSDEIDKAVMLDWTQRITQRPDWTIPTQSIPLEYRNKPLQDALDRKARLSDMDELDAEIANAESPTQSKEENPMSNQDPIAATLATLAAQMAALQKRLANTVADMPAKVEPAKVEAPKPTTPKAHTVTLEPIGSAKDGRVKYQVRSAAGALYGLVYWPLDEQAPDAVSATFTPTRK